MSNDQSWLQQARATWDERAPWWDEMSEANAIAEDRAADLVRTATALGISHGARLLDAGCGSGQFAIAYAQIGIDVTAIDLSPAMLARARHHAGSKGVSVIWREGDLSRLTDPDHSYDAIHARLSLQFVPSIPAALVEFRRVLKPNGRLYASVPGALSPIYANAWRRLLNPDRGAINYATPWELELVLRELGWRILDCWGSFGPTVDDAQNVFSADATSSLDIRLQQAAATTWAFVAE